MCASQRELSPNLLLVDLAIEKIKPNPNNPRLQFPQDELDRLADSIDQEGILVPITVYRKGKGYILVDGERRYRCALTLGLETVPALVVDEKPEKDVLVQMFNIHLIREPWRDIPTARALERLADELTVDGEEPSDATLRDLSGLSLERVRRLRYVMSLPEEWQAYINEDTIPLNFFWELKRNVIDPLAKRRPDLYEELGGNEAVASAFVEKRLDGVITDTVGLRNVRPIINFAADEAEETGKSESFLDDTLRSLVTDPELSIDDAYEDTVQIMVEADKLQRRTDSMLKSFERLLGKARTDEEREYVEKLGKSFISKLRQLLK